MNTLLKTASLALALTVSGVQAADLVVYTAGPKGLANKLVKDFEQQSGVGVQVYQATTGRVLGRLKAEEAKPVADVVILASWPAGMGLQREGLLHSIEIDNADKLHPGWNGNNQLFGYSGSALGITYNTRMVEEIPASVEALASAEWEGQIVFPDPNESGSALDFVTGYVNDKGDQAWELFQRWDEYDLAVNGANRPALNQVVNGAKKAVIAGVDYMGFGEKKKGNPIEVIYPEEGTVIAPRPAMILESSDNKKKAEQFVTYLLSDRAQQIVADALLIPGRNDIPADSSRPGYADIKQLNIDWEWMLDNQVAVTQRFSGLFR
ncbi:extracellular solute-binding protein [Aliagarivorans marinus]|uniref:extracellular solute-binding protein n=1 Tax=Aliagarivorans marinus TaxID=561965 RepID=UPI00042741A6|nr:extracellular solute-binding protein [Aliagarivorans marinus]